MITTTFIFKKALHGIQNIPLSTSLCPLNPRMTLLTCTYWSAHYFYIIFKCINSHYHTVRIFPICYIWNLFPLFWIFFTTIPFINLIVFWIDTEQQQCDLWWVVGKIQCVTTICAWDNLTESSTTRDRLPTVGDHSFSSSTSSQSFHCDWHLIRFKTKPYGS